MWTRQQRETDAETERDSANQQMYKKHQSQHYGVVWYGVLQ